MSRESRGKEREEWKKREVCSDQIQTGVLIHTCSRVEIQICVKKADVYMKLPRSTTVFDISEL